MQRVGSELSSGMILSVRRNRYTKYLPSRRGTVLLSLGLFKGLKGSSTLLVNLAVKGSSRGQMRVQTTVGVLDTDGDSSVRVKCWWKQAMRSNTGCAVRPAGCRTRPHLYNTRLSTTHTHTVGCNAVPCGGTATSHKWAAKRGARMN